MHGFVDELYSEMKLSEQVYDQRAHAILGPHDHYVHHLHIIVHCV